MLKIKLICMLAILLMSIGIALVYATLTIYSNVDQVTVQYTLTLSHSLYGGTIRLTAHLQSQTNNVSQALINFYICDSGGSNMILIGSDYTDIAGIANLSYNATANGDYYFMASYSTP